MRCRVLALFVMLALSMFTFLPDVANAENSAPKSLIITEVELAGMGQDKDVFQKSCKFKLEFPTSEQWIEIHNPTNQVVETGGIIEIGLANTTKELKIPTDYYDKNGIAWLGFVDSNPVPPGYWAIELFPGYWPNTNATIALRNGYGTILDSTPPLSDTFNDTRTWQRIDGQWIFKESTPCAEVPEFPVSVMVISIAIGIMLYATRLGRQGIHSLLHNQELK